MLDLPGRLERFSKPLLSTTQPPLREMRVGRLPAWYHVGLYFALSTRFLAVGCAT